MVNKRPLLRKMVEMAQRHGLKSVTPECFDYLALAVETHLAGLLKSMAKVAQQRTDPGR